ncbi:hypothetical protein C6341_g6970 [Phytophthora cactorum]|nr:hypothetical protein C6341_g6970 [Phytophthora cactorum]
MAESQDLQKEYADAQGIVLAVFKTKLGPRFIGPFKVVTKKGLAYMLNLPKKMRTHPAFYVGLLKRYQDPAQDAERTAEGAATDRAPLQLINLTLEVDAPVLKGIRCLEQVHPTVHLFEIFCQAGV